MFSLTDPVSNLSSLGSFVLQLQRALSGLFCFLKIGFYAALAALELSKELIFQFFYIYLPSAKILGATTLTYEGLGLDQGSGSTWQMLSYLHHTSSLPVIP